MLCQIPVSNRFSGNNADSVLGISLSFCTQPNDQVMKHTSKETLILDVLKQFSHQVLIFLKQ
nr:MAG TPA: hypothetical protein [Caudoviricetes sp.]DAY56479.1 MAG TPA: hypothetical protein [Caudoviricetes sp.]